MPRGYITRVRHDHPNASTNGRVAEQIVVASAALGRALPAGVEVHHVNEIPSDNRPSNLVICQDRAYHQLLHTRMRALRACGNPSFRNCVRCHSWDDPQNMRPHDKYTFVHRECARIHAHARHHKLPSPFGKRRGHADRKTGKIVSEQL